MFGIGIIGIGIGIARDFGRSGSGSGSGWVRAFNRGLRKSHCGIRARPGIKEQPHKRLPERGGTLSVER